MYRVTIWRQCVRNDSGEAVVLFQDDPEYLDEYASLETRLFDSEQAAADWLYTKAEQHTLPSLRRMCFTCEEVNEANVIGNLHTDLGAI